MDTAKILKKAESVLRIEAEGIRSLIGALDKSFVRAVEYLFNCRGRVVVTGVGKSGIVCRKIAATLSSTGTPSFFLHAGEASHGDLGMVKEGDVILAISYGGETEEVIKLLPTIKRLGIKLIVMSGKSGSTIARHADVFLNVSVKKEACPLSLAPTASTTATLALGDALALVLLEQRRFGEEDFALRHPGGLLGKKLLLRVEDLMHKGNDTPLVRESAAMKDALFEITSKRLRLTGVINSRGWLVGAITDGDLRRGLEKGVDIFNLKAGDIMTKNPKTISKDALAADAVNFMKEHLITTLFILQEHSKKPLGVVHLYDIMKSGII